MFRYLALLIFTLLFTVTTAAIDEFTQATSGKIAVVGMDYNIYSYDVAQSDLAPITTNANRTRRYQWPTWSRDGRLAYFCCDLRVTRDLSSIAYISDDGISPGEVAYEGANETIIHAAWSPAHCDDGTACRELALLINDVVRGGISIEMLTNNTEETRSRTIGVGSPFYYNWNPDGTRMIFHRNNDSIDIFDMVNNDVVSSLREQSPGTYQSPAWSPVDNRVLYGVAGESGTDLVVADDDNTQALVTGINGFVSFLWSPDGRYIAYRSLQENNIGSIFVVDAETGETITSTITDGVLAFFWSPDSRKLAFVSVNDRAGRNAKVQALARQHFVQDNERIEFVWSKLDIATGEAIRLSSFLPTYEMQYMLTYFDQFAPSHRIWSPDSRYLTYSTVVDLETQPRAVVIQLDTENLQDPRTEIASGVFSVWSFD